MATVGPNNGGTFTNTAGANTNAWSFTSGHLTATCVTGTNQVTDFMDVTGFGFSITGTIAGISVSVTESATSTNVQETTAQLIKAGAAAGSNLAGSTALSTSASVKTYGGSANLWGTTWTDTQISASNFGIRLKFTNSGSGSRTTTVSVITITVTYAALYNNSSSAMTASGTTTVTKKLLIISNANSISGQGITSLTCKKLRYGSCVISGNSNFSGNGYRILSRTSAMSGNGNFSGSGCRICSGNLAMSGIGYFSSSNTIISIGLPSVYFGSSYFGRKYFGKGYFGPLTTTNSYTSSVNIVGIATLSDTGKLMFSKSCGIVGQGNTSHTGNLRFSKNCSISGAGSLNISGRRAGYFNSNILGSALLSLSDSMRFFGNIASSGKATSSLSGNNKISGNCSIIGVAILSETGKMFYRGSSAISGQGITTLRDAMRFFEGGVLLSNGLVVVNTNGSTTFRGSSNIIGRGTFAGNYYIVYHGNLPTSAVGYTNITGKTSIRNNCSIIGRGTTSLSDSMIFRGVLPISDQGIMTTRDSMRFYENGILLGNGLVVVVTNGGIALNGSVNISGRGLTNFIDKMLFSGHSSISDVATMFSQGKNIYFGQYGMSGNATATLRDAMRFYENGVLLGNGLVVVTTNGGVNISGSVNISGNGNTSTMGRLTMHGSINNMIGNGIFTPSGKRTMRCGSNISGVATLSAHDSMRFFGGAIILSDGTVIFSNPQGNIIISSVAMLGRALTNFNDLISFHGQTNILGRATTVGQGKTIYKSQYGIVGNASTIINKKLNFAGISLMDCHADLFLNGYRIKTGAVGISGIGTMASTGYRILSGSATISSISNVNITDRIYFGGTTSLVGNATLFGRDLLSFTININPLAIQAIMLAGGDITNISNLDVYNLINSVFSTGDLKSLIQSQAHLNSSISSNLNITLNLV